MNEMHPEHRKRLGKATMPSATVAGTYTSRAPSWLVTDVPALVELRGPEHEAQLEQDETDTVAMLQRAAHKRTCHANGHRVRPVCDECKETWCPGCVEGGACEAVARSERARAKLRRAARKGTETSQETEAAARGQALACRFQRCAKCPPPRPCRACKPHPRGGVLASHGCPECKAEASAQWHTSRRALGKAADALLAGAGLDTETGLPTPAETERRAVARRAELAAIRADFNTMVATFREVLALVAHLT